MPENKSILICTCAERRLLEQEALNALLERPEVVVVEDLCRAAMEKDPVLDGGYTEIHACHPRAVRALFEFAGCPLDSDVEIVNHRNHPPVSPSSTLPLDGDAAWYPVIDYDRCTGCGQCYEFCLFGVYEKQDDGRVVVANPSSCKNNCPACARICPETAIIFPKVGESPIDGADVPDEEERKANVKLNVDEILGEDIYATLNARKQKRQSLLNQKRIEQALEERRKCSGGEG